MKRSEAVSYTHLDLYKRQENRYPAMTSRNTTESQGALDRYFKISERGSSIGTEVRAGIVTFFAMAYIIILNPLILGTTEDINGTTLGIPQVAAATALAAGVMTIAFGPVSYTHLRCV